MFELPHYFRLKIDEEEYDNLLVNQTTVKNTENLENEDTNVQNEEKSTENEEKALENEDKVSDCEEENIDNNKPSMEDLECLDGHWIFVGFVNRICPL